MAPGHRDASEARLVVIRGNSGSGKSTIAAAVRELRSERDTAVLGQDVIRRQLLKEKDGPGLTYTWLMEMTARELLGAGWNVIVEGILTEEWNGSMLRGLLDGHVGRATCFYLDVPFEETLRRHATKPNAGDYGEAEMRGWYREGDVLGWPGEVIVPARSSFEETVALVGRLSGLVSRV